MFEFDEIDDLPIDNKLIRQIAVGSDTLVLVLDDPRGRTWGACAVRYDDRGNKNLRQLMSRSMDGYEELHKVFIDPFGMHVLISLENGDNYHSYLGRRDDSVKASKCSQLQGIVVESVGWNKQDPSGNVLLGDTHGVLHETRFSEGGCKHRRKAHDLEIDAPVTSIDVEKFDRSNNTLVITTASSRLFQFVGTGSLENIFATCRQPLLREMPGNQSNLQLFRESLSKPPAVFAWCTQAGILHGQMDFSRAQDSVTSSETVLSFDSSFHGDKGLLVSRHHFFLLYSDRLVVLAQPPGLGSAPSEKMTLDGLRERTVWETPFRTGTNYEPRGIIQDIKTGGRYVYTKKGVYQLFQVPGSIHPTWKIFLQRAMHPDEYDREGYFNAALELCKDDAQRTARVQEARGDYYFEKGEYQRAAKQYSLTPRPFEEIAIKYIKHEKQEELLGLAELKLVHVMDTKRGFHDKATQICCLCTWVVQLYLAKMNKLVNSPEDYAEAQEEFHDFLTSHLDSMDKVTVCELIATSALPEEFLFIIELLTDYQGLIANYMTHNQPDKALERLIKHCSNEKYEELWYQFSPRLIEHAPHTLISGWMARGKTFLKPPRLIPALMKYDVKFNPPGVKQNQAVRYLEWLIRKQGNSDQAIHNMLLSLYAKQADDTDLLQFLDAHRNNYFHDLKYALRLCLAEGNFRACVHVYSALGLYEDAVNCALKIEDIELAKKVANQADDDPQRKKLWTQIIKHVIRNTPNGDKVAIAMLPECSVLEMEDILPYFHEFVYIQDFKKEIVECLGGYQKGMNQLKRKMDEVTANAQLIQRNIDEHKRSHHYIKEAAKCSKCCTFVLTNNVVIFLACGHQFHERCLAEEQLKLVETALLSHTMDGPGSAKLRKHAALANQYLLSRTPDTETEALEFMQVECPYCGIMKIEEVAMPFFAGDDDSWKVGR